MEKEERRRAEEEKEKFFSSSFSLLFSHLFKILFRSFPFSSPLIVDKIGKIGIIFNGMKFLERDRRKRGRERSVDAFNFAFYIPFLQNAHLKNVYYNAIIKNKEEKVMKITKKTTKAVIAIIALIAIVASIAIPMLRKPTNANGYADVSTEDWYYPAVEYMSTNGYMNGYSATQFAPYDTLSRAMFVTVLYRVSGEKVNANMTKFADVAQGTWYTEAVAWAVANGITSGTSATTFSPEAPVTREQMATFLKRYVEKKNINVSEDFSVTSVPKDLNQSSTWAKDAVQMMHKHGILLEQNGEVWPYSYATRIDTAIAFYNLLCLTKDTNKTLLLSKNYYDGSVGYSCKHRWESRHVDEVGHYESGGTGVREPKS